LLLFLAGFFAAPPLFELAVELAFLCFFFFPCDLVLDIVPDPPAAGAFDAALAAGFFAGAFLF